MNFSSDLFESSQSFTLEEANGDVDGQNIIGKIAGPFFVPNGKSRNRRYYPESLWKKTLARKDIQERISTRRMLGTIGHDQALDDDAVLQGKVSHVITKLDIRDGQGYGEAYILGTPAGKVLKTMAGAGVQMFISSRATGGYKGEFEGMPIVDENKYSLSGFDFVLDPGFLEANPSLVESLKDSMDQLINLENENSVKPELEENFMAADKELLEQVVRENGSIKKDLEDALKENETLKDNADTLEEQNASLKERLDAANKKAEQLEAYSALGTAEEIEEALNKAKDVVSSIKEFGEPDVLATKAESLEDMVSKYGELGTPEEVGEALDLAKKTIEEYKDLGSVEEINTAFDLMQESIKARKDEQNEARANELAKELQIDVEKVKKLSESMDDEEIREFFKDVKVSSKYSTKYKKSTSVEETKDEEKDEGNSRYFDRPVGKRLMESFGR